MNKNPLPSAPSSLKLEEQLCFPLYAASRLIVRRYQPFLQRLNLTYPQYLVLMVLWEQSPMSVKAIGEKLHLNSNTLTPLLKRLETLQLVSRKRSTLDERLMDISVTELGWSLKEEAQLQLDEDGSSFLQYQQLCGQLNALIEKLTEECE